MILVKINERSLQRTVINKDKEASKQKALLINVVLVLTTLGARPFEVPLTTP